MMYYHFSRRLVKLVSGCIIFSLCFVIISLVKYEAYVSQHSWNLTLYLFTCAFVITCPITIFEVKKKKKLLLLNLMPENVAILTISIILFDVIRGKWWRLLLMDIPKSSVVGLYDWNWQLSGLNVIEILKMKFISDVIKFSICALIFFFSSQIFHQDQRYWNFESFSSHWILPRIKIIFCTIFMKSLVCTSYWSFQWSNLFHQKFFEPPLM